VGGVLLARRPGHPIGPLLCAVGLTSGITIVAFWYGHYVLVRSPGALPFGSTMAWLGSWEYVIAVSLSFVLLLVFPDGRLLSRRWRPALWAALAFIPFAAVGYAFIPQDLGSYLGNMSNPYALPAARPLFVVMLDLGHVCLLIAAGAAIACLLLRWRRAGQVARQQLKWFLVSVPLVIAVTLANEVVPNAPGLVLGTLGATVTPVVIGVAVLRYRLYGIDVLLNRAALYGSLSVAVAGVYLAVVAVARGLFGVNQSLGIQVLATVIAAAALWPLRDRAQRGVDRLFFGDRGTPYDAMARLGRRVEEASSAESVLDSVVTTVADSLRLPYAAVELRLGKSWVPAAAWGQVPAEVVTFPLVSHRETVGRLFVGRRAPGEQLGSDDEKLLADLARQVGPAAHAVALRRALDASRAAQVTAREEERRRLRRDLHDGLGPTLAGLTLGLDTARTLSAERSDLYELLGRLKTETQRAVTDVRRIVYGLRPPALDELGLAGSLHEEITRLRREAPALSVTMDAPVDGLAGLPAAVEVAAYRIVTEALTNVARHAHATSCSVRLLLDHGLTMEVQDNGVGLPDGWRSGVGITAMRERVAELGGDLTIESGHPGGARIAACLPSETT
jgi:signal transduction histidine kinase